MTRDESCHLLDILAEVQDPRNKKENDGEKITIDSTTNA